MARGRSRSVIETVVRAILGGLCVVVDACAAVLFFFSSRRRHTRSDRDWSSDVCSSVYTLDEIKVCTGYKLDGRMCESLPAVSQDLRRIEPVYATLPGWRSSTLGMIDMSSLPTNASRYVDFLSEQIGVGIGLC